MHPFDLHYGTDTSGIIKPGYLDISADRAVHAVQYQTAIVEVFLEILSNLPIKFEDFLFIDIGSGKGRALLLASRYPFKGIKGVELSCQLHEIACRNIKIFKDDCQKCSDIESVNNDAADFELPNENTVFYLFNPFHEEVMSEFVMNLETSIQKNPRDIYIVYLKPLHRNIFDKSSIFEIYKETERYLIYHSHALSGTNN